MMTEDSHFRIAAANQHQMSPDCSNPSLSAVNAVALAGDLSWEDSFRILLEQSKRYGALPDKMECVRNMIIDAGYIRVRRFKPCFSRAEFSDYMIKNYPQVTHALIRINPGNSHSPRFCAVRRLPNPSDGFAVMDTRMYDSQIVALFLDYREIGKPKPKPAPASIHDERTKDSHRGYLYYQPNPAKRNTGDCVVRAYSAVFSLSWGSTLDLLAHATEYQTTVLNAPQVCNIAATIYESQLDKDLKYYATGQSLRDFCDRMNLRCHDRQRFFLHVNGSHVAAVIPTVIDGVPRYAVADSWDSSDRIIQKCWVFRPSAKNPASIVENPFVKKEAIAPGTRLRHPDLGPCTILDVNLNEGRITLSFSSGVEKNLSLSWVLQHCKPEV